MSARVDRRPKLDLPAGGLRKAGSAEAAGPAEGSTRSSRFRRRTRRRIVRSLTTLGRLGLAAVWLTAGFLKVGNPVSMVRSVRAFRILPESLVHPVAYGVPYVEIALGVLLVLGLAVRTTSIVAALLLALYVAAIASVAARGLRIECGCFSSGGDLRAGAATHYTADIVRDSALVLLAVLLAIWPRGYAALDNWLFGPTEENA